MASEGRGTGEDFEARRRELEARRQAQRRDRGRRRLLAGGALVVLAIAAAVLALGVGGESGSNPDPGAGGSKGEGEQAKEPTEAGGGGEVRNATPQPGWGPHPGSVPIIEYHVLGTPDSSAPYPELYVSRPDFHRQMQWLEDSGFEAVTLEQVEAAWFGGGTLPPQPVVISFDDGYRPQFTFALPELRRHGWAGVLNLKAEGSDLYESNVRAMLAAGWELASHTIDHSDLTTLDAAALRREVAGSRQLLRREFGVPVANFCYPAGQYDRTVIAAVEAAGYTGATTEIPGYADRDQPFELERFEILGSSGVEGLAADLGG